MILFNVGKKNNPPLNTRGIMKSLSYFQETHVDSCLENFMQVFYGENYVSGGLQSTLSEASSGTIQNVD